MKTNEEIELLTKMIERAQLDHSNRLDEYKKRLLAQWTKVFKNDKQLQKDAENAQNGAGYIVEKGGIYSWYRVSIDLKEYADCKEYFEEYLQEQYCLTVDWENDCFMNYIGDDNYIIQDDTRHDNGVWQGHKCIFNESEYLDDDGEVNITKRNELIESHMEKSGCFPDVFRIDSHGNVFFVKTTK